MPAPAFAPPPPPTTPGPGAAVAPPRRRSRRLAIAVILVVSLVVAASLAYFFLLAPATVDVNLILVWSPNNVCGLDGSYYSGFNTSTGSTVTVELGVPNFNNTSCELRAVTTNSSGFTVTAVGLPLAISPWPPGPNGTLNVSIAVPSSSFSGNLNLIYS